jgi:hypothetical protein
MTRTLKVFAFAAIFVLSLTGIANAQTSTATTTVDAKTAKKIADLQNQLAILKAKLPVVRAEGDIDVAKAETAADIDRVLHAPKEERKDRDAVRHPDNGCRILTGCNVMQMPVNGTGLPNSLGYPNIGGDWYVPTRIR